MPAENPVRIYTVAELERLATDYLAKHFGSDVLIPVDVDLLVEQAPLDVWPKLQANHKVLGMVLRDVGSGELFIYIDEDLADSNTPNGLARYQMTVAEVEKCPPPSLAHRSDPRSRRFPQAQGHSNSKPTVHPLGSFRPPLR